MSVTDVTFAGSIPVLYERFLGPLLFEPYAQDMARRMRDAGPRHILETAAGTGIVTRAMAAALPEAEIVATDLNPGMLDLAATRLDHPRVTWKQADAQALPFDGASFDAVACQFGVMFFPDKVGAYREAARVLKPGGRLMFNVWDRLDANPVSLAVHEAIGRLFPDDPPGFIARVPFGYNDPERIRSELQQAGFSDIVIETVTKSTEAPSAREPAAGLCQGSPLRNEIEARAKERLDEITDRTMDALAEQFGPSQFTNRMSALVVTARR
ncbi:class I SAM-dependent methyltransferase [Microvirga puerhi]|uniref:Methyltransferase domain-containing protein n=1 Tax=Microvirga puerhi TaxID=2876078 RepID=A0ABS7VV41_9HYPH|nr:methyltransferase domain-containing protein [Microvirga puerhi]MBZ6078777.1 methyltransferase domain-containing protein [Microvirga puerhi]